MTHIIAFAASTSRQSINKSLVTYAAHSLQDMTYEVLDLNDFAAPLYSIDEENENGIPQNVKAFKEKLEQADGIIVSLAEHNGNFTAAFKSLYDWLSRIDTNIFGGKPLLLLSTSPGPSGASNVLAVAKQGFPIMGGQIIGEFSLPEFFDNFTENEITSVSLKAELQKQIAVFASHF